MRRRCGVRWLLPLLLGACAMGGLDHRGLPAERLAVGGFLFDVRFAGGVAEVTRRGFAPPGRLREVRAGAVVAAERATGCEAVRNAVEGDPAVTFVPMRCG